VADDSVNALTVDHDVDDKYAVAVGWRSKLMPCSLIFFLGGELPHFGAGKLDECF
jgi:hypothetical protein